MNRSETFTRALEELRSTDWSKSECYDPFVRPPHARRRTSLLRRILVERSDERWVQRESHCLNEAEDWGKTNLLKDFNESRFRDLAERCLEDWRPQFGSKHHDGCRAIFRHCDHSLAPECGAAYLMYVIESMFLRDIMGILHDDSAFKRYFGLGVYSEDDSIQVRRSQKIIIEVATAIDIISFEKLRESAVADPEGLWKAIESVRQFTINSVKAPSGRTIFYEMAQLNPQVLEHIDESLRSIDKNTVEGIDLAELVSEEYAAAESARLRTKRNHRTDGKPEPSIHQKLAWYWVPLGLWRCHTSGEILEALIQAKAEDYVLNPKVRAYDYSEFDRIILKAIKRANLWWRRKN